VNTTSRQFLYNASLASVTQDWLADHVDKIVSISHKAKYLCVRMHHWTIVLCNMTIQNTKLVILMLRVHYITSNWQVFTEDGWAARDVLWRKCVFFLVSFPASWTFLFSTDTPQTPYYLSRLHTEQGPSTISTHRGRGSVMTGEQRRGSHSAIHSESLQKPRQTSRKTSFRRSAFVHGLMLRCTWYKNLTLLHYFQSFSRHPQWRSGKLWCRWMQTGGGQVYSNLWMS